MQGKIRLSQQGYEEYLKKLEEKKKRLEDVRKYKGTDAIFQGDTWHDNPILYQTELEERSLMRDIANMQNELQNNVEIVENIGDEEIIDIGDVIKIDMIFSEEDREEEIFKLVATMPKFGLDVKIREVSINSPMGEAIYQKKVGDKVTYSVENRTFTLQIKEKVVLGLDQEKELKKTK